MYKPLSSRCLYVTGVICLIGLPACLTLIGSRQAVAGQPLSTTQMAELYGGACEDGCETTSNHCDGYELTCSGPGMAGQPCFRCVSDSQKEECIDWGYCITWPINTCSECVWDTDHDCGEMSWGACVGFTCEIFEEGGTCGSVTKCHTNNP